MKRLLFAIITFLFFSSNILAMKIRMPRNFAELSIAFRHFSGAVLENGNGNLRKENFENLFLKIDRPTIILGF